MTSKDTLKKIRSILKDKKQQGKFIESKTCYGYMREAHLILEPEVAPVKIAQKLTHINSY